MKKDVENVMKSKNGHKNINNNILAQYSPFVNIYLIVMNLFVYK